MSAMTKRDRVRATLAGEPVDRPPFALWGHDFLREWSPEDLVAQTMEAYRAGDWDFIKLNPRWSYFAEAWGNSYQRPTDQRMPRLETAVVRTTRDLAGLGPVDAQAGVFAEHLEALRAVVAEAGAQVDVVQTIFSPLAVAGLLCGQDAGLRELAAEDAAAAHHALSSLAATLIDYARASIACGAAGIFYAPLFWASYDASDDGFYAEFGRRYDLQVLDAVRDAPFNILHVCRNHNMLYALLDYPVAAFNWADQGEGNPTLSEARARSARALMGGIDHARLHTMTPEDVRGQAAAAIAVGRGVFVTGGCGIAPQTPQKNKRTLRDACEEAASDA